jgi:hypothetical protein
MFGVLDLFPHLFRNQFTAPRANRTERAMRVTSVPLLIITKLASLLPTHATAASNDP